MQQDSEETMLTSEQWFLCYFNEESMNYGKLVNLIGSVLRTNSADVLRKHPKVVKKCLKEKEYVFNDCELKYRQNWMPKMNATYLGMVTGQSRKERKQLEQDMRNYWRIFDI